MPTPKVTGTNQPVRKPDRIRFDPTRGLVRDITFEAADPAWLVATANGMLANRWIYDFDQSVPARLSGSASGAELGGTEITTDNWQVIPNELQVHLLQLPGPRQLEIDYPGAISQIKRNLVRMDSEDNVQLSDLNWSHPVVTGAALTASQLFLDRLMREETHKAEEQYVLYHTTNVSQNTTTNVADNHIGQIYTTAQLLTEVTNGALWAYPLPLRLVTKINAIVAPGAITGYTVGWRKLPAKEITEAENRVAISSEYWFGQWDTTLKYPVYS